MVFSITEFILIRDENGKQTVIKQKYIKIICDTDIEMLERIDLIQQHIHESESWDVTFMNIDNVEWFNRELELLGL